MSRRLAGAAQPGLGSALLWQLGLIRRPPAAGVGTVSTALLVLITAVAGGDSRAHRRVNVHIPGTS